MMCVTFTPVRAQHADVLLWRKGCFSEYPDIWISDLNFRNSQKISNVQPATGKLYRWGEARLVEWSHITGAQTPGDIVHP
jgi:hypothetical protein